MPSSDSTRSALRGDVSVDGEAVMARVRRERDRFVGFVTQGVEAIPAADKLVGYAQFVGDDTLAVGDVTVETHATVIATGSTTSYPPAWNALGDRLVTNETLFEWTTLPASVAVFGPGVIGLELGQALHRLGVRIKVFGRGGGVGPLSDPELVTEARRVFGAEFYLDTDAHAEVSLEAGQVAVRYRALDGETRTEHFDYLLAATGRRPNVARLGLEHTSVSLDEYGVPLFDRETMQCGSSPIFIAGDVNADVPLLHEAADEGRIAGDNAARFPDVHAGMRRSPLSVVFTDPQIAVIGSGWRGAREVAHVTGRVSFDDQGRARVMQRNRGSLHVYAEIAYGPAARRGDDRSRRRAPGAPARVGAPARPDDRRDAQAAVLPSGGGGRAAYGTARRLCATRRRGARAARRVTFDQRR